MGINNRIELIGFLLSLDFWSFVHQIQNQFNPVTSTFKSVNDLS